MNLTEADGGMLNDITVGLNWHLNSCTKIMFNYVLGTAKIENEIINENTFQTRIQIDF